MVMRSLISTCRLNETFDERNWNGLRYMLDFRTYRLNKNEYPRAIQVNFLNKIFETSGNLLQYISTRSGPFIYFLS